MSAKLGRRLAKIEAQLRRIDVAICNCKPIVIVDGDSELAIAEAREALKNRPCPAHGFDHRTRLIVDVSVPCETQPKIVRTPPISSSESLAEG
jgi:hypothetical protein